MKTKRIDQYICIDTDQIIIDELKYIIEDDTTQLQKADKKYWKRMAAAAEVLLEAYIVK